MSGAFTRMKRVTDPLDDRVKARIVGRVQLSSASSGSEYSAQANDDVISPSLSDLFFGFTVGDSGEELPSSNDSDSECDPQNCDSNLDFIKPIVIDQTDEFQKMLTDHVFKALQVFSSMKSNRQKLRNVMTFLRNCGYNAAICKTKWESCGGLTAGNHEFIDVVRTEYSVRYFVDLDFASEFEIARPTSSYERLLQYIPCVFVGKIEDLKQILRTVSEAVRRSLKSRDLLLPPWRKHRFMQNKWLGTYKRTTNLYPAETTVSVKQSYGTAKCHAVGFDATVGGMSLCFL